MGAPAWPCMPRSGCDPSWWCPDPDHDELQQVPPPAPRRDELLGDLGSLGSDHPNLDVPDPPRRQDQGLGFRFREPVLAGLTLRRHPDLDLLDQLAVDGVEADRGPERGQALTGVRRGRRLPERLAGHARDLVEPDIRTVLRREPRKQLGGLLPDLGGPLREVREIVAIVCEDRRDRHVSGGLSDDGAARLGGFGGLGTDVPASSSLPQPVDRVPVRAAF